jgi:parallel beta-helix repeat protein
MITKLVMLLILITQFMFGTIHNVPGDFSTIQQAIAAASAGDSILVDDGTYTGDILIDKSIMMMSVNGKDVTGIQDVVTILSDSVMITGFTFIPNLKQAIIVGENKNSGFGSEYLNFSENNFIERNGSISFDPSFTNYTDVLISYNTFYDDSSSALHIIGETFYIAHNIIDGCRESAVLVDSLVTGIIYIHDNTFNGNFSSVTAYSACDIRFNTIQDTELAGVFISPFASDTSHIIDNEVIGGGSHSIVSLSKAVIEDNFIHRSGRSGIMASSDYLIIQNNTIEESAYDGIDIRSPAYVAGNTIFNSPQNGIRVREYENGESYLANNWIEGSSKHGMRIEGKSIIENNDIFRNAWDGIFIMFTANENDVANNRVSENRSGVVVLGQTKLRGNTIEFNDNYGVELAAEPGVEIILGLVENESHGNNIIRNNNNYQLANFSPNHIYACGNYWVSLDSTEIDNLIFDNEEDSNSGEVTFLPCLNEEPTAIDEEMIEILETFSLEQNYPNPFNPSTTIKYSINVETFTRLNVYDILGREVATLVNKKQRPGNYEVEWNADNFSSGVYYYKLTTSNFTDTKKMILLR